MQIRMMKKTHFMDKRIYLIIGVIALILFYCFGYKKEYSIQLPNGQTAVLKYGPLEGWDYDEDPVPVVYKTTNSKVWSYYGCGNPDCYRPKSYQKIDTSFFDGEYHTVTYAKILYTEKN